MSVDEKGYELDRIQLEISLATQQRDAESAVAAEAKAALAVLQGQRNEKLSESDAGAELKSLMAQVRALEPTKSSIEKDSTSQSQRVKQLLLSERKLQQVVLRGHQAAESDAGVVRSEKVLLAKSVDEKCYELDRIRSSS